MKSILCLCILVLTTSTATSDQWFEKLAGRMENKAVSKSHTTAGSDTSAKWYPDPVGGQNTQRKGEGFATQAELEAAVASLQNAITEVAMNLSTVSEDVARSLSTITAMLDQTTTMVMYNSQAITANYDELIAVDSSLSSSVSTLQTQYEIATVRMCKTGLIENACGSYCRWKGEQYPNGVTHRVVFDPPFHTTPKVMTTLKRYDDGGSLFRFETTTTPSAKEMSINIKTWSTSKIYSAKLAWIACA